LIFIIQKTKKIDILNCTLTAQSESKYFENIGIDKINIQWYYILSDIHVPNYDLHAVVRFWITKK